LRSPFEMFFFDKPEIPSNFFLTKNPVVLLKNFLFFSHSYSIYMCAWHPRNFSIFFGTRDSKIFKWELNMEKKKKKTKKTSWKLIF
jgi:hypothetical protein